MNYGYSSQIKFVTYVLLINIIEIGNREILIKLVFVVLGGFVDGWRR